jgi:uncharacterized membrane protein
VEEILNALFRWLHIFAGIVWIGMLYFFNWVNGPFAATMDADTKKKVVPELMPRALFWFRWGAAWTWITGVLLLGLVFYMEKTVMFGAEGNWTAAAGIMVAVTFLAPFIYDALQKSQLGKDPKTFGAVAFVLVAVVIALMARWAHFEYRAFNIHMGALFGSIMAFNVWYRIWPAQQVIIKGIKGDGPAADPALVAFAGTRSRQNVYMSVPLVWSMINYHTTVFAGGNLGIAREYSFVVFLVVVLVGWHIVWQLYKKAPKVKGF